MISIKRLDYKDPLHAEALIILMDAYAQDPMGGGRGLQNDVKESLPQALSQRANALSILALDGTTPVGLLNAFEGFSTFSAKPLMNIHDVIVEEAYRRQGVSQKMIAFLEDVSKERGCCKITLEVLSENIPAKASYKHLGFAPYQLDLRLGVAEFWQKTI